jgi:hypothetical protein
VKKLLCITIVFLIFNFWRCTQPENNENPQWLKDLISKFESEAVGNPPQSIWQYSYNGKTVYYVPAQCCDQFSVLYDSEGKILCAPDGGFSVTGDRKCTDFFSNRKDEKLIWQDKRTR